MYLATFDKPGVNILVSENEYEGVTRAAGDLALDFGRVLGTNGTVQNDTSATIADHSAVIIAGSIGSSNIIDELVASGKINVSGVQGKWESYIQQVVLEPVSGIKEALVIAGSDKRGTIYGMYAISENIGVSPWYWWANVPSKTRKGVWVRRDPGIIQGPPSVRYRGVFINDEGELISWAKGKFAQAASGGYFTADFYEPIFELLLRLKANYLWPGMKQKEAFYKDDPGKGNGVIADTYGIVMGTSHHEPSARAYYEQKDGDLVGAWDWSTNEANVSQFMDYGINRAKDWETIFTMGMRGDGDTVSPTLTAPELEVIIQRQQEMIQNHTGRLEEIPQVWTLYKEVGKYWQAGMNVSDLVTLMWTDDNYGNLLRVPLANETSRRGGHGIYYHFGYVGSPRSYIWMNTNQLVKAWEQLHYAFEREVRQIWIANVQDLKPYEVPMNFFLDMAYDMSSFTSPNSTAEWYERWAAREFGSGAAKTTAQVYTSFGRLAYRRKWEMLSLSPFPFSTTKYDEAFGILQEWDDLAELAQSAHDSLPASNKVVYLELVLTPVLAGRAFTRFFTYQALAQLYQMQSRTSTNNMAAMAVDAFDTDTAVRDTYDALWDGKFAGFMSAPHYVYPPQEYPPRGDNMPSLTYINDTSTVGNDSYFLGLAVQGTSSAASFGDTVWLRSVDPYMPPSEQRWLDVYTRINGTFTYHLKSNVSYVGVSNSSGELKAPGNLSDIRSILTIDWEEAPPGLSWAAIEVTGNETKPLPSVITAILPINKTTIPSSFNGFVESNGVVSIEAAGFTSAESKNDVSYLEIPDYGRTASGVKLWPVTAASQEPLTGPKLTYTIYTFTNTTKARLSFVFGATLNLDPLRPLKFAYALDSDSAVTKQIIGNYSGGSTPTGWSSAVIANSYSATEDIALLAGEHTLSLWLLEPGVLVQKIWFDLGGKLASYLGPPASFRAA
ncbi:hypothetical protein PFICI_13770 [Pestalotiopsis fici W106-1]|uniref:Gylcosyl hydrolase 115 C-terminal domain-containing protein n=1 Tax=Pestalotiopsis fici (strain W106-1 / CGMCC3.15140) TaxID=1229662 RepID=W3WJG0_PESFW|nr:uncharacterized protein PFICI_13770 [Pestalotiopsis fici W106-1]ETS73904.1 hypothetical protein PFICI_13770 [Pestalotiopsis fici W106-1]